MIVIIDYGMGNLRSVEKKLLKIGAEVEITNSSEIIKSSTKIILPGVGNFKKAVENIQNLGLWDILNKEVIENKKPILGICLGMQLMARHSDEGNANGFGWFDAEVLKFKIENKLHYKVPHIGWNSVETKKKSFLFNNLPNNSYFYFVHAYYFKCNNSNDIIGKSEYEIKFTSAIQKDNIYGVQFHPEKSQDIGETLFNNFLRL